MVGYPAHLAEGILAVSSRCQQRLPGQTAHEVAEIDREVRDALTQIGEAAGR